MKDRKLATRYARALLGALPDAPAQNSADEFLSALREAMRDGEELRGFLLNPAVPQASKVSFFEQLAIAKGTSKSLTRFLSTIVAHGRLANLPSIADVFHDERERAQGSISATLTAAVPMSRELEARAAAALERISGRKINLKVEIDSRLLGGAVARVGSMLYDGSLETQLRRLRRSMGEE
jgi:F-type H+-transporting ATPase subunit delta